ncbi:MAG: SpoIIE family protein phosphatase [Rhodoferax sp.]|nr:SpoIIE family protein phosphatase [Rhodoferax sp.]
MDIKLRNTGKHTGILARMAFTLILTTTVIFGGFMGIYHQTTQLKMNTELVDLSTYLSNQLSKSMASSIWNFDMEVSYDILDATMLEKQVHAIVVKDAFGIVICATTRDDQWNITHASDPPSPVDTVVKREIIKKDNEQIGAVEVFLTKKFLDERIYSDILKMFVTLMILNTLLFVILFISIRNIIILPIRAVVTYLGRLSLGDIPVPITDPYKGEFNDIRNSLNILIESTNQTIAAMEGVAAGNLMAELTERSEQDKMMLALKLMIRRLDGIMTETTKMILAVEEGRLDIRGNSEAFEGGWRKLLTGVNHLVSGLRSAVSEKASLEKEMELARKIQKVLLPQHPKISGYDIATCCEPAEQVGGDYYDVISVAGFDWIVIGDVSGHGVTAGLVMMMVQTAIHTVLIDNPEVEPSQLLRIINQILYKNIQLMEDSKHMTIVVLACKTEGSFCFSGLHDDMLIRRAGTGNIENIRTDGMWIGIEPHIEDYLSDSYLTLEPGDCILLFTDGITEAIGKDGEIFGEDRLKEIFESAGNGSVSEIQTCILEALRDYKKADDVTLFVMKRNELASRSI